MTGKRILLLEDDEKWADEIKTSIRKYKADLSIEIDWAEDCMDGMKKLMDNDYDLLIADIVIDREPKGLCLIRACAKLNRIVPAIIVSGLISLDQALESVRDYNVDPRDVFLKRNLNKVQLLFRVFEKLKENIDRDLGTTELDSKVINEPTDIPPMPSNEPPNDTAGDAKMMDTMKWILFWVFISLFVIIVAGTLGILFFDFGKPTPEERSLLVKVFVAEVGVCVPALFYSVFNINKK